MTTNEGPTAVGAAAPRTTRKRLIDDRYRVYQQVPNISDALWEVGREYGVQNEIAADEQATVAEALRRVLASRSGPLRRSDIETAFATYDLHRPPRGYAKDVIARLERLDRR